MNPIIKEIEETVSEYTSEMIAQGAWSGHAYAPEYLSSIYKVFVKVLDPVRFKRGYKEHITADMFVDYENLINKVYQSDNISCEEKGDISDIINDKFLDVLESMAVLVRKYYKQETGHELVENVD